MIELIFVFLFVSMSVGLIPLLGIGYIVSLFKILVYYYNYYYCWSIYCSLYTLLDFKKINFFNGTKGKKGTK